MTRRCRRVLLSEEQQRLRTDVTRIEVEHAVDGCWHAAEDETIDAGGVGCRQRRRRKAWVPPTDDSELLSDGRRAAA